jgi:uncharacterized metal-binding protein YceD (DUF177 family)
MSNSAVLPETDNPFTHPIQPSALGDRETVVELEADDVSRAALVPRTGLLALNGFRATLRLKWIRGGRILRVAGELHADVVQNCVITLEPVASKIRESFELYFAPVSDDKGPNDNGHDDDSRPGGAVDIPPVGMGNIIDGAEPYLGDSIDLADIAAGELFLALDPYPRKPGVQLDTPPGPKGRAEVDAAESRAENRRISPFEVLAALKGKK